MRVSTACRQSSIAASSLYRTGIRGRGHEGAGAGGGAVLRRRLREAGHVVQLLGQAIGLAARIAPGTAALHLLGTAVGSALVVAQPWLTRLLLNALTAGQSERALLLATAYAATLAVPAALTPLQEAAMSWL